MISSKIPEKYSAEEIQRIEFGGLIPQKVSSKITPRIKSPITVPMPLVLGPYEGIIMCMKMQEILAF